MDQKYRTLSGQPQNTPARQLIPLRWLAPICHDAFTRHGKGRPPRRVWQILRLIVFERHRWTCVYCGTRTWEPTCDHVVSVSRGSSSTFWNLVTACLVCNLAKATKTPAEWRTELRQGKREV